MSRVFEALRSAEEKRRLGGSRQPVGRRNGESALRGLAHEPHPAGGGRRRARVVTLASLKGGVGKTVIAANLAVYLRNLRPQLPTLLLAGDDDPLADRMFAEIGAAPGAACAASPSASAIRGGRHGIFTLRPSRRAWHPASESEGGAEVAHLLGAAQWDGLVVVDTPSDFGARTRAALAASDVVLIPVCDTASLDKVAQLFALMDEWGLPRDGVHVFLSQLDLRIKYREGESSDVLGLLVSEIRRRGWPLLGAFLSRTPKVASLYTRESGRPLPVAEAAPDSVVHRQFLHLADDVLGLLERASQRTAPAGPSAGEAGWTDAQPSSGGAGRVPAEADARAERTPAGLGAARPGLPKVDIRADRHRPLRLGKASARVRRSWPARRAVGLVLLFVVAGPALAVAMLIGLDLPRATVNEVAVTRRADLRGSELSALPVENATPMLGAPRVANGPSFALYDDENTTSANLALASFSWPSSADARSQLGHPSILPVPEPSTALLLAAGLVWLGMRRRHARP